MAGGYFEPPGNEGTKLEIIIFVACFLGCSTVLSAGLEARLYGRQDARRYIYGYTSRRNTLPLIGSTGTPMEFTVVEPGTVAQFVESPLLESFV